jgi:hypothetical protein
LGRTADLPLPIEKNSHPSIRFLLQPKQEKPRQPPLCSLVLLSAKNKPNSETSPPLSAASLPFSHKTTPHLHPSRSLSAPDVPSLATQVETGFCTSPQQPTTTFLSVGFHRQQQQPRSHQ